MDTKDKIRRWLKETRTPQNTLAAITKIDSGNMSRILHGTQSLNLRDCFHIARVMNVSMDWLYDPETDWPPVYLDSNTKALSKPEEKLLSLAHDVSRRDPDPGQLLTAFDRLFGLPVDSGVKHEIPMMPRHPASPNDETKKNAGRKIS